MNHISRASVVSLMTQNVYAQYEIGTSLKLMQYNIWAELTISHVSRYVFVLLCVWYALRPRHDDVSSNIKLNIICFLEMTSSLLSNLILQTFPHALFSFLICVPWIRRCHHRSHHDRHCQHRHFLLINSSERIVCRLYQKGWAPRWN